MLLIMKQYWSKDNDDNNNDNYNKNYDNDDNKYDYLCVVYIKVWWVYSCWWLHSFGWREKGQMLLDHHR